MRTESSESQTQQDGLEKWNVTQSSTDGKCTTESSYNVYRIIKFRYGNDNKDLSINGKTPYFRILIHKYRIIGLKRLTVNGKNKYVRILIKKIENISN